MSHFPFLHNLAEREDLVRNGKLTSIIFLRDKNSKGQEVSGYIDYAHRLKSENFEPYFERKKKLMPRPSDLSYYNWETQHSTSNSTPNFQVIADNEAGLLFKNKRDRKVINVDPKCLPVCVCVCVCVACCYVCAVYLQNKRNRRVIDVDPT